MDKATAADLEETIKITVDGHEIEVKKAVPATDEQGNIRRDEHGRVIPRSTTIYDAASQLYREKLARAQSDPHPLPPRIHGPGGRLPRLRGSGLEVLEAHRQGGGGPQAAAGLPAPGREDDDRRHGRVARRESEGAAALGREGPDRAADDRSPVAVRQGTAERRRLRARGARAAIRIDRSRDSTAARPSFPATSRRSSSPSTTTPASSAIAVSAAAT